MTETNDFDEFYNASIAPSIGRMQTESKKADRWGTIGILSFTAFITIGYLGTMQNLIPGFGWYMLILIATTLLLMILKAP